MNNFERLSFARLSKQMPSSKQTEIGRQTLTKSELTNQCGCFTQSMMREEKEKVTIYPIASKLSTGF